jgi:hypothetical protein
MSEPKQNIAIHDAMTVDAALNLLDKYEAGVIKMVPRDDHDNILGAVIVVSKEAAPEVLRVIEQLEDRWADADKTQPHSLR